MGLPLPAISMATMIRHSLLRSDVHGFFSFCSVVSQGHTARMARIRDEKSGVHFVMINSKWRKAFGSKEMQPHNALVKVGL